MAADVYCPECLIVETSDGPRVRLCAQHAERDRLAAELAEARNVEWIHKLVKQEGDAPYEQAFDFLLRQVNLARAVVEAAWRVYVGGTETSPGDWDDLKTALAAHDAEVKG